MRYAYNCSVHRSTGTVPFELVLSRPQLPLSLHPNLLRRAPPTSETKENYPRRLYDAILHAHSRLQTSQESYKKEVDRSVKEENKSLSPGDFVYLDVRECHVGNLYHKAQGPYDVLSKNGNTVIIYRLRVPERFDSGRVTPVPRSRPVFI